MSKTNFAVALHEFEEKLFDHPLVKKYLYHRDLLAKDEEVKRLSRQVLQAKKSLSKITSLPEKEQVLEDYKKALETYENHPLVANFNFLQEEVDALLHQIKTQLVIAEVKTKKE
ncbi:MAG: YlbF family regulator [Bacilli bacterium]|jgi:cell fate (sporulation/competence/biofilm development) regulator YlbF (YheA/YmcA/DUF963 family)